MRAIYCILVVLHLSFLCTAYDLTLDEQKDTRFWKFRGDYVYLNTLRDGGRFAPDFERPPGSPPVIAKGVWYFGYVPPDPLSDNDNYGEMKYSLKHHLMAEVIVRILADPSAIVELQGREGKVLNRYKSTGKAWCDVMFSDFKKLSSQIRIAVNLTQPETFLLVDKVTIGAMSPIKSIDRSTLNPCQIVGNETAGVQSGGVTTPGNAEGRTTTTPPVIETVEEPSLNADNTLLKQSAGVSTTQATLIRVVRNAVPTITSTKSTADGLKCDCSCNCVKAADDENAD